MAQSLVAKKTDFAVQIVAIAEAIIETAQNWDELNSHYFANGYNSGGANVLTQADLDVSGYLLKPLLPEKLRSAISRGRAKYFPVNRAAYAQVSVPQSVL